MFSGFFCNSSIIFVEIWELNYLRFRGIFKTCELRLFFMTECFRYVGTRKTVNFSQIRYLLSGLY